MVVDWFEEFGFGCMIGFDCCRKKQALLFDREYLPCECPFRWFFDK